MIRISLLPILLLLAPNMASVKVQVSYRLLESYLAKATDRFKEVGFVVSVDRELDRAEVEGLICEIVRQEKPVGYDRLSIAIYHDLDEYIPAFGAPILERKLIDHYLARYSWNVRVSDNQERLHISRGKDGKRFSPWRRYGFDHIKRCVGS